MNSKKEIVILHLVSQKLFLYTLNQYCSSDLYLNCTQSYADPFSLPSLDLHGGAMMFSLCSSSTNPSMCIMAFSKVTLVLSREYQCSSDQIIFLTLLNNVAILVSSGWTSTLRRGGRLSTLLNVSCACPFMATQLITTSRRSRYVVLVVVAKKFDPKGQIS